MTVRVLAANFASATTSMASMPAPCYAEIAFAGRSNVGKSTLLGALSERKGLARISKDPGRTRSLVFFDVRAKRADDEIRLQFVDLPGYGYAKISRAEAAAWKPLVEAYLTTRQTLRVVLLLIDIRRGVQAEERELLTFLQTPRTPPLAVRVVATKLDKLSRHERKPAIKKLRDDLGVPVFGVSGEHGDGLAELWNEIVHSAL